MKASIVFVFLLMGCAAQKQPKPPLAVVNVDTSSRMLGVDVENICPGSIALLEKKNYEEITLHWDTKGHCWSLETH